MLLNLASVCNAEDKAVLWGFISPLRAAAPRRQTMPLLDRLVGHAIAYYRDFVQPAKHYRPPTDDGARGAGRPARRAATRCPTDADAEAIQTAVYEVGKRHAFADLRAWFQALYEVLLGQTQGPRLGSFIALYGIAETAALIRRVLAGRRWRLRNPPPQREGPERAGRARV